MDGILVIAAVCLGAAFVWFGLGRLGRWAGARGFVYNKHNPRPPGAGSLRLIDEIYQPAIEHVIEQETSDRIRADRTQAGGEPRSGSPPDPSA